MRSLDDYLNLITSWHRGKPRFTATVSETIRPFAELQTFFADLELAFDVDTAIGVQLDAVGERVGLSRYLAMPLPDHWFSFNISSKGFGRGYWYNGIGPGTALTRMEDETYRTAIRAKIFANINDGLRTSIQKSLDLLFSETNTYPFVQDNCDLSCIIAISGAIPSILYMMLLVENYIDLTPNGIHTDILVVSVDQTPMFGLGVENEYISGFDVGSFGVSPLTLIDS